MLIERRHADERSTRIDVVKRYVAHHIDEPLTREGLAEVAGFSLSHFKRLFASCEGENLAAYLRRLRLERAGRKLRMGAVDITQVALAAGYDTHAAFGKAFKQRFGMSPSEFRRLDCRAATRLLKEVSP